MTDRQQTMTVIRTWALVVAVALALPTVAHGQTERTAFLKCYDKFMTVTAGGPA